MNDTVKSSIFSTVLLFLLFLFFTWAILTIDTAPIGPLGSEVGFSALNGRAAELIGTNSVLYKLSDLLGLFAILCCGCFGLVGLCQWIKRKNMFKVNARILMLGCYYLLVIALYIIFNVVALNYRPVLTDGELDASYPSSHTILAVCVFITAPGELIRLLKNPSARLCRLIKFAGIALALLTTVTRVLSGVHWLTDIIGGLLLSAALISLHRLAAEIIEEKLAKKKQAANQ